jgi:Phosphodiester glycosidase
MGRWGDDSDDEFGSPMSACAEGRSHQPLHRSARATLALLLLVAVGCGPLSDGRDAADSSRPAVAAARPGSGTTTSRPARTATTAPRPVALPPPEALAPLDTPALPGEGQWRPVGRGVDGRSVVYVTTLRPVGSSVPAGVAWMDTDLLRATLYSGSVSPGHGPWTYTAPVQPVASLGLVCAFNGGFKLRDAKGGYYAEGRLVAPLVAGAASLVIRADGSATVGAWGRDVSMTPGVVAVRQNLTLLVDGGRAVPGLSPTDTSVWGSTLGSVPRTSRSALGVTADGALIYVSGRSLTIVQLADLLVRAGAVRAMELDINPKWDTFTYYTPSPGSPASPASGTDLLPQMTGGTSRFFDPAWARDFITMSAR